jgi:hypothetical protein
VILELLFDSLFVFRFFGDVRGMENWRVEESSGRRREGIV